MGTIPQASASWFEWRFPNVLLGKRTEICTGRLALRHFFHSCSTFAKNRGRRIRKQKKHRPTHAHETDAGKQLLELIKKDFRGDRISDEGEKIMREQEIEKARDHWGAILPLSLSLIANIHSELARRRPLLNYFNNSLLYLNTGASLYREEQTRARYFCLHEPRIVGMNELSSTGAKAALLS